MHLIKMKKAWNFISYLGSGNDKLSLNDQVVILNNRINFLVAVFMLAIFLILRIQNDELKVTLEALKPNQQQLI